MVMSLGKARWGRAWAVACSSLAFATPIDAVALSPVAPGMWVTVCMPGATARAVFITFDSPADDPSPEDAHGCHNPCVTERRKDGSKPGLPSSS